MTQGRQKTELLAPAGDFDSLRAAVNNGADAVYLGARDFSARSKAANFDREELSRAVAYAHLFGVKVYLTLNTILKPSEYNNALDLAKYADSVGVDAFIVQDLMFVELLHSTMQDVEIHLSTQCGIHNLAGAHIAQKLGVKRIVLSRETTLEDIKKIKSGTDLEIEFFVHGALCVAFSGNCYLSSLSAGLSGNRGKCLQLCRKKYECKDISGYLLSAKDIDLSEKINTLIEAGVVSLKIEGRMKKPEYVGGITAYYRAILDGKNVDRSIPKKLFNRGDCCHAYLDNPTENVIYPFLQGHKGYKIGSVSSLSGNVARLRLEKPLAKGDGIKFIRKNKEVGNALLSKSGYETTYKGNLQPGDSVYITTDSALEKNIRVKIRKLPVSVTLSSQENKLISELCCGETTVTEHAEILEQALSAPLSSEKFRDCFSKCGEEFELTDFNCSVEGKFVAISSLNAFRRAAYSKLANMLVENSTAKKHLHSTMQNADLLKTTIGGMCDFVFNEASVIIQTDCSDAEKYLPYADVVAYSPSDFSDITPVMKKLGDKGALVLPVMIRGCDAEVIARAIAETNNVIINNIGHIDLCKGKNAIFGPFMNIINPDFPFSAVLSPEYDGKSFNDKFVYAFGRFALMTFAHCPNKTIHGGKCVGERCDFNRSGVRFRDENENEFALRHYKINYCYAQLLNCVPLYLLDKTDSLGISRKFIDLTGYSSNEGIDIITGKAQIVNYTRGYFNRKLS